MLLPEDESRCSLKPGDFPDLGRHQQQSGHYGLSFVARLCDHIHDCNSLITVILKRSTPFGVLRLFFFTGYNRSIGENINESIC